jgi:hypothetical protein
MTHRATRGTRGVVIADRELSETLTEITGIARQATPSVQAASVTLIREPAIHGGLTDR